ncbi:hypothetical protein LINPERPRIM_LOCUS16774, partial [Linum perenne]
MTRLHRKLLDPCWLHVVTGCVRWVLRVVFFWVLVVFGSTIPVHGSMLW